MDQINWLNLLREQFPDITFVSDDHFKWASAEKAVHAGPLETQQDVYTLLHETAHAIAGHHDYAQDIQLLKMERQAWNIAANRLAPLVHMTIDPDFVEQSLDTYRDWLHARSLCPRCHLNGVQQDETHYQCLNCKVTWKVNDARQCQLRRYVVASTGAT